MPPMAFRVPAEDDADVGFDTLKYIHVFNKPFMGQPASWGRSPLNTNGERGRTFAR